MGYARNSWQETLPQCSNPHNEIMTNLLENGWPPRGLEFTVRTDSNLKMSATEADKAINAVIKFKKKKEKRNTLRKRSEPDPVAEEEEDETIIQPKKKSKPSLHVHTV